MDISKVSGLVPTSGCPASARKPDQQPEASGHELVPVAPTRRGGLRYSARPSPAFVAQLIATAQHAPQTRARGRIAPAEAVARYASAVSVGAPTQTWDWSV